MDRKRQKLTPRKNDVQKECQDAKITALERKLEHMENKLKLVIAELEQVKEERTCDKINFEREKCELESKIDEYKEQCSELESENEILQRENKRLQKYLQDLESPNINVDENSQINLYNTDLKSQITKVNESDDDALDINSLPNEIILKIFGYLEQNQLGQIARVCRRWNVLTKIPVLWKRVNVRVFPSHRFQTSVAESFINRLPSCVSAIRLDFTKYKRPFNFEELCLRLQEKCPHLQELSLIDSEISVNFLAVIELCSQFLQDVKNLIFHNCMFYDYSSTDEYSGISKIEILELNNSYFDYSCKFPFSKMPHLKQLHLYGTNLCDAWFEYDISSLSQLHVLNVRDTCITNRIFPSIQNYGHNLKELCLCAFHLKDHHLNFTDSAFPHLKTICLVETYVTCEGVVSLIQSCPSVQNVYVDEAVAVSFAAHPFVIAKRCKTGIVKAAGCIHDHNVDYSHT